MFFKTLITGAIAAIVLAAPGQAATVGSFDGTRIFTAAQVVATGSKRSELRTTINSNGDTLAAATGTLSAAYLAGVDVFMNSALSNSNGILSGSEQTALVDWVTAGGVLVSTGEQGFFNAAYSSFLNPFGISLGSTFGGPQPNAVWASDAGNPLLANGVAGSAMSGVNGVALVSGGMTTTLATLNGNIIGVSKQVGNGFVVAIGDSNIFDTGSSYNDATDQFVRNVLNAAPGVQAVPLPAGAVLLLSSLAGLGLLRRRA